MQFTFYHHSCLLFIEIRLDNDRFVLSGMTLYELHAPLLFIAKTQWNAGVIDEAALKSKMIEALNILKEAATILCLEPPDTPEGEIGLVAKESLTELEQSINNL